MIAGGGHGGAGRGGPGPARARSRTPARRAQSAEGDALQIAPDPTAVVDIENEQAFLVVLRSQPKGRKYYPLHLKLTDPISVLRWEFGRVARRGVNTFSLWQAQRQFHDDDLISTIDRAIYLEVWRVQEQEPPHADHHAGRPDLRIHHLSSHHWDPSQLMTLTCVQSAWSYDNRFVGLTTGSPF